MEITVSTGTLHHRYGAGEGMQTGYRLSPGTAGDTQRRGVSHTRSIPRNFIQTPVFYVSQSLPERLPGLKSCEIPTIPPAEAEKSPILVPRIATPRNEETEISITLFYLLIH